MTAPASNTPVTGNEPPVPGSPEYDQAMAAKFEAAQNAPAGGTPPDPTPNPERPAWLPEKFQNPEDLAKAYKELETKLGEKKPDEAPKAPETPPADEAKKEVEKAGLDYNALQDEFYKSGALSEDTYKKLADAGIPKDMVDGYVKGQIAIANQLTSEVHAAAGGKETYDGMLKWASTNLTTGEQAAFNKAMDYGTIDDIRLAVSGLVSKYNGANGSEPKLLGGTNTGSAGEVYRSVAELKTAMADPRYAKDEAYREDVKQKLARSNIM